MIARQQRTTLFPYTTLFRSQQHGRIVAGAWVLLRTSWSKRADPKEYINVKEDGPHTPGWTPECSAFLAKRSEEHTSELQSLRHLVCRLLLEKKNITY